jgi:Ser/Thr protein kinase RdoA (MazF antagonist)
MARVESPGISLGEGAPGEKARGTAPPTGGSRLEELVKATFSRSGVDRLQRHLEACYGIAVTRLSELDVGVFRVDRRDGPSWVARLFPAARAREEVVGDAEILDTLAGCDYPAERCATPRPVSWLDGQGLLVTEHLREVPRQRRREAIRSLGGLRALGGMLGRLNTLAAGEGVMARHGGAWHHLTDGAPRDEIAAAAGLLAAAGELVAPGEQPLYDSLREELERLDDCAGLPQAFIHPDFVMANVLASPRRGLVVVDWAGAGRGPRLWPLGFLLYSQGVQSLARVDLVVAGYSSHVRLEPEELVRLAGAVRARPVILATWAFCMRRRGLAEVLQQVAAAHETAEAIAARARAAFADAAR